MGEATMHMLPMEVKRSGPTKKVNQYISAVAAAIGAVIAGTILAWTSPSLPQLQKLLENGTITVVNGTMNGELYITEKQGSWVGSILAIGAAVGALPTGIMAQRLGRRITLLALAVPFLLSWLLIIFAGNVGMLYAARFFAGLGTGGMCVAAPMYIGEVAETSIRGALGAFFQLFLTVGILITFVVGGYTHWRILSIVSAVLVPIYVIVLWFMPETPTYLLSKHRRGDAERVLRWLRGPHADIAPELELLQNEIDEATRNQAGVKELFTYRASVMALVCSLGLMLFQQFSGINAVIFYTDQIFQSSGSSVPSNISTIIVGVVQTIFTIVSSLLIEKAGRRILLLQSCIVMGTCLIVLGVFFKLKEVKGDAGVENIGWIPLVSLVLFIVSFSLGFGPIPWMMMAELFSAEFKGAASGIAVIFNWALVFLVTLCFPIMTLSIGSAYTFWIFAGFMIVCIFFVFFLIPETKGKTNAEIQAILAGKRA